MEIILLQDLASLGFKNDVVKVKDGYGRNYLIPQKLAVIANKSNLAHREETLKQQKHKLEKMLADAQQLAQQLAQTPIELIVKANDKGKVFGRITTTQIANALAQKGVNIDKKIIVVEDIKQLGEYVATARLHREVTGEIKINVVPQPKEE